MVLLVETPETGWALWLGSRVFLARKQAMLSSCPKNIDVFTFFSISREQADCAVILGVVAFCCDIVALDAGASASCIPVGGKEAACFRAMPVRRILMEARNLCASASLGCNLAGH